MTNMTQKFLDKLNSIEITAQSTENQVIDSSGKALLESLNRDMLILVISYMTNADICRLACVNSRLAATLHSDFIWERIWIQRYEGLWRDPIVRSILCRRNILWNPFNNWGPPSQGWKLFLFEFEYGWVDWILAGSNCSILCLIGLNGGIYNITSFVPEHPGSPETILDHSGQDGTVTFNEIGHSLLALSLKDSFLIYQPSYIATHLQNIVYEIKEKRRLEFQQNPLQALKGQSQNTSLFQRNSTSAIGSGGSSAGTSHGRRTISIDIDTESEQLVILPETEFEQRLNNEKDFIRQIAESHYREINPFQEEKLFNFSERHDALYDSITNEQQKKLNRSTQDGMNENDGSPSVSSHSQCHEIARRVDPNQNQSSTSWLGVNHPTHPGQPREFYDPLAQQWWIWWSCCGCGRAVPRELMK